MKYAIVVFATRELGQLDEELRVWHWASSGMAFEAFDMLKMITVNVVYHRGSDL